MTWSSLAFLLALLYFQAALDITAQCVSLPIPWLVSAVGTLRDPAEEEAGVCCGYSRWHFHTVGHQAWLRDSCSVKGPFRTIVKCSNCRWAVQVSSCWRSAHWCSWRSGETRGLLAPGFGVRLPASGVGAGTQARTRGTRQHTGGAWGPCLTFLGSQHISPEGQMSEYGKSGWPHSFLNMWICEPMWHRTTVFAFCYFGCEFSCGIGKSYVCTVLTSTGGIVCAVGVGRGCIPVCTYVFMCTPHGRYDCCCPAASKYTVKVGSKRKKKKPKQASKLF